MGKDEKHERILATTRRAGFRSLPYLLNWARQELGDDLKTRPLTITAVVGQLVLSVNLDPNFLPDENRTEPEKVEHILNGITNMVKMLLVGAVDRPEPSRIHVPKPGEATKLVGAGRFHK